MKEVGWTVSGVAASVISVLFCLHWRRSRDRFFLYFAIAFCALGASSVILLTSNAGTEEQPSGYVVRLLAFLLIIVAIVDKNRPRQRDANRELAPFELEPSVRVAPFEREPDDDASDRIGSVAGDP